MEQTGAEDRPAAIDGHQVGEASQHLDATHMEATTRSQRMVDRATAGLARPGFVAALLVAMVTWMAGNWLARAFGWRPLDPPPFEWLEFAVSSAALLVTALILTTQRREDQLAVHRQNLILEMAVLLDRKTATVVSLLEEIRRDSPGLPNRVDRHAELMAEPMNPKAVLEAIKDAQAD